MSQKRVQNEDERAELRDQDVEVPASQPSSRLGLHLWSPILKRDEKDLEKYLTAGSENHSGETLVALRLSNPEKQNLRVVMPAFRHQKSHKKWRLPDDLQAHGEENCT